MKKFGFTLAEVLITLGIIGVVAALTAPALVTSSRNEANGAKLAVVVSNLENAFTSAIATEGVDNIFQTRMFTVPHPNNDAQKASFVGQLGKYLINSGFHSEATLKSYYTNNGKDIYRLTANGGKGASYVVENNPDISYLSLLMKNGATAIISFGAQTEVNEDGVVAQGGSLFRKAANVFIDVNGLAEPNTLGRDIFMFALGQNGILYPAGGADFSIYNSASNQANNGIPAAGARELIWSNPNTGTGHRCIDGSDRSGAGCTARLIEENYKMTY